MHSGQTGNGCGMLAGNRQENEARRFDLSQEFSRIGRQLTEGCLDAYFQIETALT